jgi:signal transduction histidine kinase
MRYLSHDTASTADGEMKRQRGSRPSFDFDTLMDGLEPPPTDMLGQLFRIHDYERQRMSQELHDSAGQLIVCLQLSIARLRNEDPEHASLIEEIQDIAGEISQQIRSVAFLDYPAELSDRGLSLALEGLVRGFGRRTGIDTAFVAIGDIGGLSDTAASALLRVAQEALVNVHRHAHASSARVMLKRRDQTVELNVSDNGVGLPLFVAHSRGVGLQSMRHRVESLGGNFRAISLKRGVKISASVPIQ